MKLVLPLLACVALAQHNPVLPGDYPDPSVIRVGREYWATATTSHWAPIFPLLRSTDLKNWTRVGAVFNQRPEWAEINFWAPEIAEWKGGYFVYYTAKKKNGPLCVAVATASKPEGPYTDHGPLVCQEAGSIDAVPVTDDDGQRWLIWKEDGNSRRQPTPLWAQRLDASGTGLTGEKQEILRNDAPWEGQLVEGAYVVKKNGWWYLFYSGAGCCGVKCNYALGVARSRKLLGPYEKNPANPILKENANWRCPGHGSLVSDRQGRTWLLYHAYDPKASIYVGRQGLLDEVVWGTNGWPSLRGPSAAAARPLGFTDPFEGKLRPEWSWPATQSADVRVEGGALSITPSDEEAVAAILPTAADYTAETIIPARSRAGLAAWGSRANALAVTATPEGQLVLWRRQGGTTNILATISPTGADKVHLRMQATRGNQFAFSWSRDGREWNEIRPSVGGEHLPPWDLATRIALYARGPGTTARFEEFRLH